MTTRAAVWPMGMCGPVCDAPLGRVEPCLRVSSGRLEFRSPVVVRFVLWSFSGFMALVALAAGGAVTRVAATGVTLVLASAALHARSWRSLLDGQGWHHRDGLVPWDDIAAIKFLAAAPGAAIITCTDGSHHRLWNGLPTAGAPGRFDSEAAIARLAHQVAHRVGRPPIPVVVGVGKPAKPVLLDPRCARCVDPV